MAQDIFTAADLPILDGRIYHLALMPGELSPYIVAVGDPGRAAALAETFFSSIEVNREHRGLRTCTGLLKRSGCRVSIVTTGMGTQSTEIVLNEVVALFEIDLARRERISKPPRRLTVIRLGTSGALQADLPLGINVISRYAVGLDNTGLFYETPAADSVVTEIERKVRTSIIEHMPETSRFLGTIFPYAAKASEEVVNALSHSATSLGQPFREGITVSNCGFFAPQGRDVSRVAPSISDIDAVLSEIKQIGDLRIENMEMESSFLFHFLGALGHRAGSICIALANRRLDTFDADYQTSMANAANVAFEALARLAEAES